VLERVRQRFRLEGDICIETNPADVGEQTVRQLRETDVRLVSLGVQSFQANSLAQIGRRYSPAVAVRALSLLAESDFTSVNADLMFALPGQQVDQVMEDLAQAAYLGADQLTAYPLFTFPYTSVGRYLHLKSVRMPDLRAHGRTTTPSIPGAGKTGSSASVAKSSGRRAATPRSPRWLHRHRPWRRIAPAGRLRAQYLRPEQAGSRRRVWAGAAALRLPFTAAVRWWWLYAGACTTRAPLAG
jgi:hypothetical protein